MISSKQENQSKLRYNERSWAIELISYINKELVSGHGAIKRASGEYSLSTNGQVLFPDVLLFGDQSTGKVLQGWELKLPDTPIDDPELIQNAASKAQNLGLDSFVLWNGKNAKLYTYDEGRGAFIPEQTQLYECPELVSREDVARRPDLWQQGAREIIGKLNDFFVTGQIIGVTPQIVFSGQGIINQLLSCQSEVVDYLKETILEDKNIDAKIKVWWDYARHEYPGYISPEEPLAYFIIFHWFNRFIFTNILVAFNKIPLSADIITPETTIESALERFKKISENTNYWAIIGPDEFDKFIPETVWVALKEVFKMMADFEFSKISQDVLSEIVKSAVLSSIKKTAGLYATPGNIAELLVRLAMNEKDGETSDPFCGTGTIVERILQIKSEYHIPGKTAVQQTWASDKFAFPIQVATLAVASPQVLDEPLKVFVHDAFDLSVGEEIELRDPQTGKPQKYKIPAFSTIVSNLPFVRFEDFRRLNPAVFTKIQNFYVRRHIPEEEQLSGRGDLYSYVPFLLYDLLEEGGYLGVITSNSWLSTAAGKKFWELLKKFYSVEYIVVSDKGRWFHNTDIVTNLLICRKTTDITGQDNQKVSFVTTKATMDGKVNVDKIATDIIGGNTLSTLVEQNEYSIAEIKRINDFGLGINACFCNLRWLFADIDRFSPTTNYMDISRGERRGWDRMFYPSDDAQKHIEQEFLKPILKTNRGRFGLTVTPDSKAFCCTKTIEELQREHKEGALKWIDSFSRQTNGNGVPLPDALDRGAVLWYQMDLTHLADFVLMLNPDRHFMIQHLKSPSFANQRLIRFSLKSEFKVDWYFIHALLNSTLTYFQIEALGFGRGLGVLDINSSSISSGGLHLPSLSLFSDNQRQEILTCFHVLEERDILPIDEELRRADRVEFDTKILQYGGFKVTTVQLYDSFMKLYHIRKEARQ